MENVHTSPEEMEILVSKIEKILSAYSNAPIYEDEIYQKIKMLEIWVNIYKHGVQAANKLSDKGTQWLAELSVTLKMPAEDLSGKNNYPHTAQSQTALVEKFNKAATNVNQVNSLLEKILPKSSTVH